MERRAVLLAAARDLFDEGGAKFVTVRRLVERSGVTAPTIYNLAGNRDAVLEQALLEHHEACIAGAASMAQRLDVNIVSGFAETLWRSAQIQPRYARRQILLVWRGLEGRRLARLFTGRTVEAIHLWVRDLCGRSRLAKRIGHDNIAAAIEAQIRVALLDWADGTDSLITLRRKLARAAICLLRFADEATLARIPRWLEELDQTGAVQQ